VAGLLDVMKSTAAYVSAIIALMSTESNPEVPTQKRARYTVTMGTSEWNVATYGMVEFLRRHPFLRAIVAILWLASLLVFISAFTGLRIPGTPPFPIVYIFIAPTLLWMATVSGPSFELVFPAAQASAERQIAEKQFEKSQTPEDALNLDFKRLSEYYAINQAQARSSFRWAKFSMFVGFATIIAGVWLFYFRVGQPDKFMVTLSAATGCVINLVSGLFLNLHSKTQDRALSYYEPLARLQRLSMAMRLVEAHQDAGEQAQARNLVIQELLASSRK
jgi:hypothetical protein